jgi:hypothetical protein
MSAGAPNGAILTSPRIYFAQARDVYEKAW